MVREILERMTPVGRRMMAISIVAFSIYALSSVDRKSTRLNSSHP